RYRNGQADASRRRKNLPPPQRCGQGGGRGCVGEPAGEAPGLLAQALLDIAATASAERLQDGHDGSSACGSANGLPGVDVDQAERASANDANRSLSSGRDRTLGQVGPELASGEVHISPFRGGRERRSRSAA